MQRTDKVRLKSLGKEHGHVICYPVYREDEFSCRLKELEKLRIDAIEFVGKRMIDHLPVLGKGCVGIVVVAYIKDEKVALKIRRTDASRLTMEHEAQMLKKANAINVGPRLMMVTKNFLIMEYIEGTLFPEWIQAPNRKYFRSDLIRILKSILEQAWRLDRAKLDHGELSHAPKHIIIKLNNEPCLLDFETASESRNVSNVTSLCQYLFIGSSFAKILRRKLGGIKKTDLIKALKLYKMSLNRESFENVLKKCGIL
ncbi:MAG: serine/threonine protein kinase [Candidatus Bathyarchaeota archaeon]|nr:MAG: serine/threonine protein kinase [Candidatus Bathyarchaeota archaeon]